VKNRREKRKYLVAEYSKLNYCRRVTSDKVGHEPNRELGEYKSIYERAIIRELYQWKVTLYSFSLPYPFAASR
jgi:hypothetical protein